MYPNWKKGLKVALIAGSTAAILAFGLVCSQSRHQAANECVKWPAHPGRYWRTWSIPGTGFVFVGSFFGLLAAFRRDRD